VSAAAIAAARLGRATRPRESAARIGRANRPRNSATRKAGIIPTRIR
jgi:hypothetical protein